ncbi:MAG: TlpA disulfide reductase family protein [Gemmatimonadales bacterium]|jgi:thiol-disulfide isomerase/thioredoxin
MQTSVACTALLMLGTHALSGQAQDQVGLPVGTEPEAVVIEDLDGNPVDLSTYVGRKPVLIEFWAHWCGVCEALEPTMVKAYERFGDAVDFLIVGVGVNQSPRSIRRHLEGHDSPFTYLFDERGRASRAYRAPTTAYVVILDAEGTVAYTGVGADQDLEGALERVAAGP